MVGLATDENQQVVELSKEESLHATRPYATRHVTPDAYFEGSKWDDDLEVWLGRINIQERIQEITERADATDEFIDKWELDATNSSHYSSGHAFVANVSLDAMDAEALVALEQLMRIGGNLVIPMDQHDVFTMSDTKSSEIYVVESYRGGIGIVRKMYERWIEILEQGMRIAERCKCRAGCPYCIYPPRRSEDMDKGKGLILGMRLLSVAEKPPTHILEGMDWVRA